MSSAMIALAVVLDVIGCLVAAAAVRVAQIWIDDSWRAERWR